MTIKNAVKPVFYKQIIFPYRNISSHLPFSIGGPHSDSVGHWPSKWAISLQKTRWRANCEQVLSIITYSCNAIGDLPELCARIGISCSYGDQIQGTVTKVVKGVGSFLEACCIGSGRKYWVIIIGICNLNGQGEGGAALIGSVELSDRHLEEQQKFWAKSLPDNQNYDFTIFLSFWKCLSYNLYHL